jgi:hypothetical protein
MKLLVLIISSSDYLPHYPILKQNWQSYMNKYPNIDCYFLDDYPELNQDFQIKPNHFIIKQKESLIPGILNKTILAIRELSKLKSYDFIIRTNLSSFWNFQNLQNFLSSLYINPYSYFYASQIYYLDQYNFPFGQGACLILNNFTADFLQKSYHLLNNSLPDDISIGEFFFKNNIPITPLEEIVIYQPKDLLSLLQNPKFKTYYQVRIKCSIDIIQKRNCLNESIQYILYHYNTSELPSNLKTNLEKFILKQPISIYELNEILRFTLEPLFHSILNNTLGH